MKERSISSLISECDRIDLPAFSENAAELDYITRRFVEHASKLGEGSVLYIQRCGIETFRRLYGSQVTEFLRQSHFAVQREIQMVIDELETQTILSTTTPVADSGVPVRQALDH